MILQTVIISIFIIGCTQPVKVPAEVKAGTYEAELVICNQTAKTCKESIDCENEARKRYHRPIRQFDNCQ